MTVRFHFYGIIVFFPFVVFGQPVISSFTPLTGKPGDAVTISGTGFNSTASSNVVFLGNVKGTVTAASATEISVTVPVGASMDAITVINSGTGLSGKSSARFVPTFTPRYKFINNYFDRQTVLPTSSVSNFSGVADFDADGHPDYFCGNGTSGVQVFRNTGASGAISSSLFSEGTNISLGTISGTYANKYSNGLAEDMNGDGKKDLIIARGSDEGPRIVVNNSNAAGTISFSSKVTRSSASGATHIAIGDIDGDGKQDMVGSNNSISGIGTAAIKVYQNTSAAFSDSVTFASTILSLPVSVLSRYTEVAIADMDGDGKNDILAADLDTLRFFPNAISGSIGSSGFSSSHFGTQVKLVIDTSKAGAYRLLVADFDGDGLSDIIVGDISKKYLNVFRNTSTGAGNFSFSPTYIPMYSSGMSQLTSGDVNGDGKPDLVIANNSGGTNISIEVIRNNSSSGSMNFISGESRYYGTYANSVKLGDLNGDGVPELITSGNFLQSIIFNVPASVEVTSTSGYTSTLGYMNLSNAVREISVGTHKGNITVEIDSSTVETAKVTWVGNGGVGSVVMNSMGSGYTSAPTVIFDSMPGPGIRATGTATVLNGSVTGITITNPGTGYTAAPGITITGTGSGAGATAYLPDVTSGLVYPTRSGLSIVNSTAGGLSFYPFIDFNGLDSVTIDGRVNATGSTPELTIASNQSNVADADVIRFINDANSNIIRYCILKGQSTNSASGIVHFSTGSVTGNSNNLIEKDTFTNNNGTRPANVIFSSGTSGAANSNNTIKDNFIYNFWSNGAKGVLISSNSTAFTIENNRFWETSSLSINPNSGYVQSVIYVDNTSGNNFSILNNHIGGNASDGSGTFSVSVPTSTYGGTMNGIYLNVGTSVASSVQGNTISNFSLNYNSTGSTPFNFISVAGGNVNIGTVTGNTIGAATGTGSILTTYVNTGASVYGIKVTGTGTVNIKNNSIGSVTVADTNSAYAASFWGIYKSNVAGNVTIMNNLIGSSTTANSIQTSSAATGNVQTLYGINSAGTGVNFISGNTVANLTNATTNTAAATGGLVQGIYVSGGTDTITSNTIHDLTIANANTATNQNTSVGGILLNSSGAVAQLISGNTIYGLSNTNASFAGNVAGIYYNGGTTSSAIASNYLRGITASGTSASAASVYGIKLDAGVVTLSNNLITMGGDGVSKVYGIADNVTSNATKLYYNTAYINGAPVSGSSKTYAFFSDKSNNRNYRNNIWVNARSNNGSTGSHYAISLVNNTNLTEDYNNYYISGSGGVLGAFNSVDKTTLAAIQSATLKDSNSRNVDPLFVDTNAVTAAGFRLKNYTIVGTPIAGFTTDYLGITRNATTPTAGAFESNTVTITTQPSTSTQSICRNATATPLSVTAATSSGTITQYKWYRNTTASNSGGTLVSSQDSASYPPSTADTGTYYFYVQVYNSIGDTIKSNVSGSLTISFINDSVSITSSDADNSIIAGKLVRFTAVPVNGGSPSYQWKLNGNNVGGNSALYETDTLKNGDQVKVVMTSSLSCAITPVESNVITTSVTAKGSIIGPDSVFVSGTINLDTTGVIPGGSWISGDSATATVDAAGIVKGVRTGTVTIWYVAYGTETDTTSKNIKVVAAPITLYTYYADSDGDGFGNRLQTKDSAFVPFGYVTDSTDCDDTHATVYKGAQEIADGLDNDCNGLVDDGLCSTTYSVDTLAACDSLTWHGTLYTISDTTATWTTTNAGGCDSVVTLHLTVSFSKKWYKDADGDGYSSGDSLVQCDQPADYYLPDSLMAVSGDCDDTDPSVNPATIWYKDADNDGYSDSTTKVQCSQPLGYKRANALTAISGDCNDADSTLNPLTIWYKDADNDGYSDSTTQVQCSQPLGYKRANALKATSGDCNDTDSTLNPLTVWYKDADNDGYSDSTTKVQCSQPLGYKRSSALTAISGDCNDADSALNPLTVWYKDADNDGYSDSTTKVQCSQPLGYKRANALTAISGDCNDADSTLYPLTVWYKDADNDGYSDSTTKVQCSQPLGYKRAAALTAISGDCDDTDSTLNPLTIWYKDADNDGYSDSTTQVQCSQPLGYKRSSALTAISGDCNDADSTLNPLTKWFKDADNDGYSDSTTKVQCSQPLGYKRAAALTAISGDCNDVDSTLNPLTVWYKDADNDGYSDSTTKVQCSQPLGYKRAATLTAISGDCDDTDSTLNPLTIWYKDADNDGYSDSTTQVQCFQPLGYKRSSALTAISGDCNDADSTLNPLTVWYKDADNDGFSNSTSKVQCSRPVGYKLTSELIAPSGDCNDADSVLNPATVWYKDADNDGYSDSSTKVQCSKPIGYKLASTLIAKSGDCNDADSVLNPATVWYKDADNDGYSDSSTKVQCSKPAGYKLASALIAKSGDCDDADSVLNPATIWYKDADNDGYTDGTTKVQCSQPMTLVSSYKLARELVSILIIDCDDSNPNLNPGKGKNSVIAYTGSYFGSVINNSATITLSATVKVPSGTNVSRTKMKFVNRDAGTDMSGWLSLGYVMANNDSVGTATANATITLQSSENSKSITVGIVLGGPSSCFSRDLSDDNVIITVSRPLNDFVTGGGYLVLSASSGMAAGDVNTKNNFGFNVKFNKSNNSLQGNINTIIRRKEVDGIVHVYQVKGNSMTSLNATAATASSPAKATFQGKANIQDVTNKDNPISLEGNATLQVVMTDLGEPGNGVNKSYDMIAITVWSKSGGIWFSSNWSDVKTIEQVLGAGNIQINQPTTNGSTSTTMGLTTSAGTITSGQMVTFTSLVSESDTKNYPTGYVAYFDGDLLLGYGSLNTANTAKFSTSGLKAGVHEIKAYYRGDTKFKSSAASLQQTVVISVVTATSNTSNKIRNSGMESFLELNALQNPATGSFRLQVRTSNLYDKIILRLIDMQGRVVEVRDGLSPLQTLEMGTNLKSGGYFAELVQGGHHKIIKLVKF